MNTYRTEFFAFCPVNAVRVKYALRIETKEVIKVEQIIDEVCMHSDGYHEEIADDLFRAFGGRQTLVADHHGVTIETVRGADDCAWCKGSGMADSTGRGDLERCDRCSASISPTPPADSKQGAA